MPLSKKIFIISSILLIITLLLWGAYFFSFKTPAEQAKQVAEVEEKFKEKAEDFLGQSKTDESSDDLTITAISPDPVLSSIYLPEERVIRYYSKSDKRAYQVDPEGKNRRIFSGQDFPGLVSAAWSPDGSKAILRFTGENEKSRYYYYDYDSKNKVSLKENVSSVVWMNNDRIFYKYYDAVGRQDSLNIADPDGANWKKILDIDQKDVRISPVPKTGLISFWNTPDALTETFFQLTTLLGTAGNVILSEKFGADYLWNSDGTKALISHSDAKGGSKIILAVINSRGDEYQDLEIPTLVSKAAWSKDNKTVYYALPVSAQGAVVMPNDYMSGKFNSADTFWKVDVKTGKKSRAVELNKITSDFDATDLFLNYDESVLYFTNRVDGRLYRVKL